MTVRNNDMLRDISSLNKTNFESLGKADSTAIAFELAENDSLSMYGTELMCRIVEANEKAYLIQNSGQHCSSSEEVLALCNSEVSTTLEVSHVSIYPNPTRTHLTVVAPRRVVHMHTYDQVGRLLRKVTVEEEADIDISALSGLVRGSRRRSYCL